MDDREIVDPGAPPEWRFLFEPMVFIQLRGSRTNLGQGLGANSKRGISILEIWLRKKVTTKYFQEKRRDDVNSLVQVVRF